jgi:cytochrome b subunit of formate dehydrogenase
MYRPYPFTHDWPGKLKKDGTQVVDNKPGEEEFGISNIPQGMKITLIVMLLMMIIIIIGGILAQDAYGLVVGVGAILLVIITIYIYFYIQHRILSHVRKNKDENILFNMWAEFEEREFMGPFKGKK